MPQGKGVFIVSRGDNVGWTYNGEWKKGHFDGNGKISWDDGFHQEGIFQDDNLNGQGKEYMNDNLYTKGTMLRAITMARVPFTMFMGI